MGERVKVGRQAPRCFPGLFSAYAALAAAAVLLPAPAAGQTPVGEPPSGEASGSVLGYEREQFEYSGRGWRNPFRPLTTVRGQGPRFEDLEVAGIVFNPQVGSVAVIADRLSKRRFRLREGERVGTARVVEIRPDEVVFAISTFGASRQAVLRVKKEREQEE
jgi:hypothetical protein